MGIRERKAREKLIRRKQIQNAAKEIFLSKGFTQTTMEDIAAREELSVATLYSYFKNKEELYVSLNLITLRHLHKLVDSIYKDERLTVEDKLIGFKDAMYATLRHDPLCLLNIFRVQLDGTLSSFSTDLLSGLNRLAHEIMSMIADVYENGVRENKFPPGHGMQHADIVWGIFAGLVLWEEAKTRVTPEKKFLKTTLDRAFDIFLTGLKCSRQSGRRASRLPEPEEVSVSAESGSSK